MNFLDKFCKKYSNTKFRENLSFESRVVSCGRADRHTDVTKLIVTLRNFANAPKNERTNIVASIAICVLLLLCLLLLLLLALQPTMDFSLLSDSLPFCSFFTFLSPPSYSHYLHIFFDIYNPSLPWSPSNSLTYMFPIVMSMYSYCMFMYIHRANWYSSATLTEVFPCFYLSCKAKARV